MLEQELRDCIAEVENFPKPGISFKDFTSVLKNPTLSRKVLEHLHQWAEPQKPDLIAGIESRGFMFGFALAQQLGVGYVPVRKAGKLPRKVYSESYDLEYGSAEVQIHQEDIPKNARVLIHDDLLATGGTAAAAIRLFHQAGAEVTGLCFLIELEFLAGRSKLHPSIPLDIMVKY